MTTVLILTEKEKKNNNLYGIFKKLRLKYTYFKTFYLT